MTLTVRFVIFVVLALILLFIARVVSDRFGATRRITRPLALFYALAGILTLFILMLLPDLCHLLPALGLLGVVAPVSLIRGRQTVRHGHPRDAGPRQDRHELLETLFDEPNHGGM